MTLSSASVRPGLAAAAALAVLSCAAGTPAQTPARITADLVIQPTRLVFHGGPETAQLALSKAGPAVVYDVSLVDRAMLPDGRIVERATSDSASARPLLAIDRTSVRVGDAQRELLRVTFKGAGSRAAGEYRTHLTLTPPEQPDGAAAPPAAGAGPNLRLTYSIPIIVRVGPADVRAGLAYLHLTRTPQGRPALAFDLQRLGTSSVYGDIEIHTPGADSAAPPLVTMRGVGVYPEVGSRPIVLPLARELDADEVIRVDYIDRDVQPGRVLASATFSREGLTHYAAMPPSPQAQPRRRTLVAAVADALSRLRAQG